LFILISYTERQSSWGFIAISLACILAAGILDTNAFLVQSVASSADPLHVFGNSDGTIRQSHDPAMLTSLSELDAIGALSDKSDLAHAPS
jgi:hypothetical protein